MTVSLLIDNSKCDVNKVVENGHKNGLKAMLQSVCDTCEMYEYHVYDPSHLVVSHNRASVSLIEYGVGIRAHCSGGNFCINMQTLLTSLSSWIID